MTAVLMYVGALTTGCASSNIHSGSSPESPNVHCADGVELSKQQLERLALEEYQHRGHRTYPKYETQLSREGCDWKVFVTFVPRFPGGWFGVVVDGASGKVKWFIEGA